MLLRTMLELLAIVLIFHGLIFEEKVICWENRVMKYFRIWKKGIKKQQLVGKQAAVPRKYDSDQRVFVTKP